MLDYDHTLNGWNPEPPAEFRKSYQAFLDWRESHSWDNRMATNLPSLFEQAGFKDISVSVEDEFVRKKDPRFEQTSLFWLDNLDAIAPHLLKGGFLTGEEVEAAHQSYADWAPAKMQWKRLHLRAATGKLL